MKKILFLFLLFISAAAFSQPFNTNVVFNANAMFKGKTWLSNDSLRFTNGNDTLTIGVRNHYVYITCYTCDSIHFYPAISGTSSAKDTIAIEYVIGDRFAAASPDTGIQGDLEIPFGCTIIRATVLGDQTGSVAGAIWKDTYANYPPTNADLLYSFSMSSATKSQSGAISLAVTSGDIIRFNIASVSGIKELTISFKGIRNH